MSTQSAGIESIYQQEVNQKLDSPYEVLLLKASFANAVFCISPACQRMACQGMRLLLWLCNDCRQARTSSGRGHRCFSCNAVECRSIRAPGDVLRLRCLLGCLGELA